MRATLKEELQKYDRSLPILKELEDYLLATASLAQIRIGWHCHLTEITAAAARVLARAGAKLYLSECNPNTTSDAAVEFMQQLGVDVYLGGGSCEQVLNQRPLIISDTGLVLTQAYLRSLHKSNDRFLFAASEITTSGISILRELQDVPFPVININSGKLKGHIENFHGVGDGVIDALTQLTEHDWCDRQATVIGYGPVGAGVAHYLKRAGCEVRVYDSNPVQQLIAHFDGYAGQSIEEAVTQSDLVVTATGQSNVIHGKHWQQARDGLLVLNVGHWSTELDLSSLKKQSTSVQAVNPYLERYELAGGRHVLIATEGNPVNVVMLTGSAEPTLIHLTTEILCMDSLIQLHQAEQTLGLGEVALPQEVEKQASLLALQALKTISLKT